MLQAKGVDRVAFGVDVRVGGFLEGAVAVVDEMMASLKGSVHLLFLDAADQALMKRFNSTRRPHPLALGRGPSANESVGVIEGIRSERERLAPIRLRASLVMDSTDLTVHDLRRKIVAVLASPAERTKGMMTRIMSFGFKYGAPIDADIVLDVRFLDNPYFVDNLRALSGLDAPVRDYVLSTVDAKGFLARATELIAFCLPRFETEGKAYVTIGIGCTGGRHRSVALAARLGAEILGRTGMQS